MTKTFLKEPTLESTPGQSQGVLFLNQEAWVPVYLKYYFNLNASLEVDRFCSVFLQIQKEKRK